MKPSWLIYATEVPVLVPAFPGCGHRLSGSSSYGAAESAVSVWGTRVSDKISIFWADHSASLNSLFFV